MDDEAFAIDHTGRFLAHIEHSDIIFKLIRLP